MDCTTATGACTKPVDRDCITPKTPSNLLLPPSILEIVGRDTGFTLTWDLPEDGSTVYNISHKENTGEFTDRVFIDPQLGTFSSDSYNKGDLVKIVIRPESSTETGEWLLVLAYCLDDWDSNAPIVYYNQDLVYYGNEIVYYF